MLNSFTKALKKLAHLLLHYSIYVIYMREKTDGHTSNSASSPTRYIYQEINKKDLEVSLDDEINIQSWYGGDEAYIYACILDKRIIAFCIFWYGDRYLKRNFWPLQHDEAKLVQLYTLEDVRGKGIATELTQYSSRQMIDKGFNKLFARVWPTNYPSRKAFRKSGWRKIATVIQIQPLKFFKPLKFCISQHKNN